MPDLLREFDALHGDYVIHKGRMYFADGATREASPDCFLTEPPQDPCERAKRIAFYRKAVFDLAVRALDNAKSDLLLTAQQNLNMPTCYPAPPINQARAHLEGLAKKARDAKRNYEKALAAIEAAKPPQMKADEEAAKQAESHNRQQNEAVIAMAKEYSI